MSFFWVSCQVHRALSGTNDVSFHGFEHCAQKQKEQMQKGCWKYPKQCYKKTLLFFMIMCLSFYLRTLRKKTFENVSRVCKNRKNEYKKFQRIPSRRNGCQFPVMTFSFFTTNQFPKLRLHSRPRMQNCTCDVILGWPEFFNSAVLCMLHSVYDTALEYVFSFAKE